ncbi:MAG: FHA domain-containing protein, partial [Actinobacteria bacterium]|nr:FHA domain-containing protein [Actinomycetota bacterium]
MGSALVVAAVKFGLLAVLWLFVIFAFRTLRGDLSGSKVARMPAGPRVTSAAAPRTPSASSGRPSGRSSARRLVVTEGALAGTTIGLGDGPVTLGRADDSTLVLTDDYASSRHARLVPG